MKIHFSTRLCVAGFWAFLVFCGGAHAAGGPLGIDHRLAYDDSGVWKRSNQVLLEDGTALVVFAGALWEGSDSELGKTYWQAVDSVVISSASAVLLKATFSRARPTQTDSPGEWFKGSGHNSFPSGEVTEISGAITPFVLRYGPENPWVYGLELLPLYDSVARLKAHAHWQSDVLAGWALGTGVGYYVQSRDVPFSVALLPKGVTIGWKKSF